MTGARPIPRCVPLQPRLWAVGAALAWSGCLRDPDPGGQEGEEYGPESATSDGGGADEGEDSSLAMATHLEGHRIHLRGSGELDDYDCEVRWSAHAARNDAACPDCAFAFDVTYTLDDASSREGGACADVWTDNTATVGLLEEYFDYGPVVVGIDPYTSEPYILGRADLRPSALSWMYGYRNETWDLDDGSYDTWYWRVDLYGD